MKSSLGLLYGPSSFSLETPEEAHRPKPCCCSVEVQSLSQVQFLATPWTATQQASLSSTTPLSLLKFVSVKSVIPCKHLILCLPLLLFPSVYPSIRLFSNESALHIRQPKYWNLAEPVKTQAEQWGPKLGSPEGGSRGLVTCILASAPSLTSAPP